ncbi:MAG: DUF2207 domain-containing protein, partial [Candidatus Diapherotrites archaeon]|nr:DUF2207 domain-containing protein [Candidatus Diapherotrites archaeon]
MRAQIVLILLLLMLALPLATAASSKYYTIPNAEIDMRIFGDGHADVNETFTMRFNGSYSFAYRDIPNGEWRISDVSVTENDQPVPFTLAPNGNSQRIRWTYTANYETRVFTLHYRLENAVTAYDDVGALNWKVWGDGWDPG